MISSFIALISLTDVLDAPSISITSTEEPFAISLQESHTPHGWALMPCWQFSDFARRRAELVLPTPLGPENRYAWAILFSLIAFSSVDTTKSWPTRRSKSWGRFLVAVTSYVLLCGSIMRIIA